MRFRVGGVVLSGVYLVAAARLHRAFRKRRSPPIIISAVLWNLRRLFLLASVRLLYRTLNNR